jgi:hypothetical protein
VCAAVRCGRVLLMHRVTAVFELVHRDCDVCDAKLFDGGSRVVFAQDARFAFTANVFARLLSPKEYVPLRNSKVNVSSLRGAFSVSRSNDESWCVG